MNKRFGIKTVAAALISLLAAGMLTSCLPYLEINDITLPPETSSPEPEITTAEETPASPEVTTEEETTSAPETTAEETTLAPVTDAPTEPVTDAPAEEKGCGGAIAVTAAVIVILGVPLCFKRKED